MLGVTDIIVGKLYAAQVSSDWHRVKVFINKLRNIAQWSVVGGIHNVGHM